MAALVVGLTAALYAWQRKTTALVPTWATETLLLFAVITTAVYYYLTRPEFSKAQNFTVMYLASIGIKMVAGLGYLVAVLVADRMAALPNALFFLLCYLIFTAAEVGFLWSRLGGRERAKKG